MRLLAAVASVCLALALAACGGGGDSTAEEPEAKAQADVCGPEIYPPNAPPPKKLVVKDIKVGSGPAAKRGDQVTLYFIGARYDYGEVFSRRWRPGKPVVYPDLGAGPYDVLEKGIEGMRGGGCREIIAPNFTQDPEFAQYKAVIYLVDLRSVKPAAG